MPLKLPKTKKPLWTALFLFLVLILGISIGYCTNHLFSENAKFEAFTEKIFKNEVSSNTLTLHYTLAQPEKAGIKKSKASLGTISTDIEKNRRICQSYENTLKSFSYSRLSRKNQLTLDTLLLYFHTQQSLSDCYLLEEVLSPSLGIQAQLPVLLAEYAFYRDEDITDYLNLLCSVDTYFDSILKFEQEKSRAGYFMSDATLDRILKQCSAFIENPDSNYMLGIFSQKLKDYKKLSREEQRILNTRHREIILNEVIPAYQRLMDGLEALRGTGKDSQGLAHFEGGREYYLYLLKSQVGSYTPVPQMEKRLSAQLMADCKEINLMLREQPSLLSRLTKSADLPAQEPDAIMEVLRDKITEAFPEMEEAAYEIRYVHDSMEKFLSPAFYLTPPVDTGTPNVIYINQSGSRSSLELFTTLAHEGFPGHLYQTVYFGRQKPANVRYLLSSSGYVEGWATYVEPYAYQYASAYLKDEAARDIARLAWLNRSVNLCLYSLLDVGIHYRGWDLQQTVSFLRAFGIRDKNTCREIFQYIVETPANYLKYYWGYLSLLDLRGAEQERLENDFDLKDFHRRVLETGPVPFPVLEKYVKGEGNAPK